VQPESWHVNEVAPGLCEEAPGGPRLSESSKSKFDHKMAKMAKIRERKTFVPK
jgi:hypothetical protein